MIYNVTKRKEAYAKSLDFFNQEQNFDVLFFGSSHVMNGILPMQLWDNYGIISYNMAQSSSTIAISYYNLKLACKETKPKLIVIDTYRIELDDKLYRKNISNSMHNTFDAYPLSYEKYKAIAELFDGKDIIENEFEYLFNFSLYHARWKELEKDDFSIKNTYGKGASYLVQIAKPNKIINFDNVGIYDKEETVNMEYLRKIIEYCKSNDIEILVTYLPFPANEKEIASSKYVQTICDEYNVNYINFLNIKLINYSIDCKDANSHLNVSGARKVTEYLGKYIMENYNISNQRENKAYSFWYEDYNEYIDLKIDNLEKNKKNLNNYLMLLYGEDDIRYEIKISSTREINEGTTLYELLKNLDNNYSIDDSAFEKNKDKTINITTWDNRTGEEIDKVWF